MLTESEWREFIDVFPTKSNKEVAKMFNITTNAVESRQAHVKKKFGIKLRKNSYTRHRIHCDNHRPFFRERLWTEKEELKLARMYDRGYRVRHIAKTVGRSIPAVSDKATQLRKIGLLKTKRLRNGAVIGREGEQIAKAVLIDEGFTIIRDLNAENIKKSYDYLAVKNGETYAIDVKHGKSCLIRQRTIERLTNTSFIPLFLYITADTIFFLTVDKTVSRKPRKTEGAK